MRTKKSEISSELRNLIVSSDLYGEEMPDISDTNEFSPDQEIAWIKHTHTHTHKCLRYKMSTDGTYIVQPNDWQRQTSEESKNTLKINEHWQKCLTFALNFYSRHNCSVLVEVVRVSLSLFSYSLSVSRRLCGAHSSKGIKDEQKIQGPKLKLLQTGKTTTTSTAMASTTTTTTTKHWPEIYDPNKMMIICISFLNYAFRWKRKWT